MARNRRSLLTQRLKSFVADKLLNSYLPMNPRKLLGFGSFFRGKSDPHDVDLAVVADFRNDLAPLDEEIEPGLFNVKLKLFHDWLEKGLPTIWANDGKPDEILAQKCPEIPREVVAWFSGYSRTALCPQDVMGAACLGTVMDITQRMLKGITGIKVMDLVTDESSLDQDRPYTLVWSKQRPDVDANIAIAEMPSAQFLRKEYENLASQWHESERTYELHIRLVRSLLSYRPSAQAWMEQDSKNVRGILVFMSEWLLHELPPVDHQKTLKGFKSIAGLSRYVEWLRPELQASKFRLEILRYAAWAMIKAECQESKLLHETQQSMPKVLLNMALMKKLVPEVVREIKDEFRDRQLAAERALQEAQNVVETTVSMFP